MVRKSNGNVGKRSLPIGSLIITGTEGMLNGPGPAAFTAATWNSYSLLGANPVTLYLENRITNILCKYSYVDSRYIIT